MVESEAKELSEEVMLGAVTFGHKSFQPVIEAIIELAETCAKEPWDSGRAAGRTRPRSKRRLREAVGPQIDAAYRERGKQERSNRLDAAKAQRRRACSTTRTSAPSPLKLFKDIEKEIVRGAILRDGTRIDGRDTKTVRPIDCQVGLLPRAHGSALFTRGETQAHRRRHARHRPGRADHRRARRRIPRELHAALQFPALFDRRSRPHGVARAARDRPRQARLARGAPAAAVQGELPLHDPRRLRDHRVERLVVDGLGVRRLAVADGCRGAAGAARSPASRWG